MKRTKKNCFFLLFFFFFFLLHHFFLSPLFLLIFIHPCLRCELVRKNNTDCIRLESPVTTQILLCNMNFHSFVLFLLF